MKKILLGLLILSGGIYVHTSDEWDSADDVELLLDSADMPQTYSTYGDFFRKKDIDFTLENLVSCAIQEKDFEIVRSIVFDLGIEKLWKLFGALPNNKKMSFWYNLLSCLSKNSQWLDFLQPIVAVHGRILRKLNNKSKLSDEDTDIKNYCVNVIKAFEKANEEAKLLT